MELEKCLLCRKTCLPELGRNSCQQNTGQLFNWSGIVDASECKTVQQQLQVMFLLRNILEMPENLCCQFLQDYGDPCSWVNCCLACCILVEGAKRIFDQVFVLQQQYDKIKLQIKTKMVHPQELFKSNGLNETNEKARIEIVKSHVSQRLGWINYTSAKDLQNVIEEKQLINDEVLENVCIVKCEPPPTNPDSGDHINENYLDSGDHFDENYVEEVNSFYVVEAGEMVSTNEFKTCDFEEELQPSSFFENRQPNVVQYRSTAVPKSKKRTYRKNLLNGSTKKQHLYVCEFCHKQCISESTLTIHRRKHTGEKPYHCKICGKAFRQSSHLIYHKKIHTGEKPYECNICKKRFAGSSNLKVHIKLHRKGNTL